MLCSSEQVSHMKSHKHRIVACVSILWFATFAAIAACGFKPGNTWLWCNTIPGPCVFISAAFDEYCNKPAYPSQDCEWVDFAQAINASQTRVSGLCVLLFGERFCQGTPVTSVVTYLGEYVVVTCATYA